MKKLLIIMMGIGFVLGAVGLAAAADQQVTLTVAEIDALAASTGLTLTVNSATAGQDPDPATGSTTYDITTNASSRKITASLDSAVPSGTTLSVNMAAPSGATSAGTVVLTTAAQDLVTGISQAKGAALNVSWTFEATVLAAPVTNEVHTVTLTLTN